MVMPPGEAGTYRIHFTGTKDHNVKLRARARDRGWSLSEKGFLRIDEDGEPLTGEAAELRTFADRGRGLRLPRPRRSSSPSCARTAARSRRRPAGRCRRSIDVADLRGDLHCIPTGPTASTRSRSWPRPPDARGHAYQVLTDHSSRWRSPMA